MNGGRTGRKVSRHPENDNHKQEQDKTIFRPSNACETGSGFSIGRFFRRRTAQQRIQPRKGRKNRGRGRFITGRAAPMPFHQVFLVLVVVTIQTKQLPIAAVGRIVCMIVVFVMHGQFGKIPPLEFPAAAGANMREQFQRAAAITALTFFTLPTQRRERLRLFLRSTTDLFQCHAHLFTKTGFVPEMTPPAAMNGIAPPIPRSHEFIRLFFFAGKGLLASRSGCFDGRAPLPRTSDAGGGAFLRFSSTSPDGLRSFASVFQGWRSRPGFAVRSKQTT